jgi:hypothetical protein
MEFFTNPLSPGAHPSIPWLSVSLDLHEVPEFHS